MDVKKAIAQIPARVQDNPHEPEWLVVALAEYAALRDEITTLLSAQQAALTFGAASAGVVAAAALHVPNRAAATAGFLVLLPGLTCLVLLIWLNTTILIYRAGDHLCELEKAVRDAYSAAGVTIPGSVFGWETKLREDSANREVEFVYQGALVWAAAGIATVSTIVGFVRGLRGPSEMMHVTTIVGGIVVLLVVARVVRYALSSVKKAMPKTPKPSSPDRDDALQDARRDEDAQTETGGMPLGSEAS
jgi:hypothetical protein